MGFCCLRGVVAALAGAGGCGGGVRPGHGLGRRDFGQLTEREREVLSLVARGLSNTELASTLHVSLPTVKTHVSRILTKLDARDRTQLVVIAYEAGLVSAP